MDRTHGNIIFPKDLEDKNNKFNKWSFKQYRKKDTNKKLQLLLFEFYLVICY